MDEDKSQPKQKSGPSPGPANSSAPQPPVSSMGRKPDQKKPPKDRSAAATPGRTDSGGAPGNSQDKPRKPREDKDKSPGPPDEKIRRLASDDTKVPTPPEEKKPPATPEEKKPAPANEKKPASGGQKESAIPPNDKKPPVPANEKKLPGPGNEKKPPGKSDEKKPPAPPNEKPPAPPNEKPPVKPNEKPPATPEEKKPPAPVNEKKPPAPANEKKPPALASEKKPPAPTSEKPSSASSIGNLGSKKAASASGSENEASDEASEEVPAGESKGFVPPFGIEDFRRHGKELIDYICDYLGNIEKRRVTPLVEPGFLRPQLPEEAPEQPEKWDAIIRDVETKIMPGVTHWQHPRFHAYFPAGNAFPSIMGDMLSDAIGCIGFSWASSPACTELEMVMMDWVVKMLGLPDKFLCPKPENKKLKGGGVIQGSASDCVLVCLLAARHRMIKKLKEQDNGANVDHLLDKLIAYCSEESHSCVEKAAMIQFVKIRKIPTDENMRMRGQALARAIAEDKQLGFVPFFVSATLGTTASCAFDPLDEIGKVCKREKIWFHVDAAYGGAAFVCPEFRNLLKGIDFANSFNFNPSKWMLVNFDCSLMWVDDRKALTEAFVIDPFYLQHDRDDREMDYRHWGVPLSRRFRALKLWFVIRCYGIEKIQEYIREHVRLAKRFEDLMDKDERFELPVPVNMGLVCFRMKVDTDNVDKANKVNERLLAMINQSGKLHMIPAKLHGDYIIRFAVCRETATDADIDAAYKIIGKYTDELLEIIRVLKEERIGMPAKLAAKPLPVEDPAVHDVFALDTATGSVVREKRPYFVTLTTNPKLYTPTIPWALEDVDPSQISNAGHRR